MSSPKQLTTDGKEVPHPAPAWRFRLSNAQSRILRHMGMHGNIRSVEAGRIVHEERNGNPCVHADPRFVGCCRYAASDGGGVMRRLEKRGIVEKTSRGLWVTKD